MRIFTIDQGNTNSTTLCWNNDEFEQVKSIRNSDYPIIVSNVSAKAFPKNYIDLKKINNLYDHIPLKMDYSKTLGVDRVMCALSAYHQKAAMDNALIIDAGTFTTIDFIEKNIYRGGMIIPGDATIIQSYQNGSNLYEKKLELKKESKYPLKTTSDCITQSIPLMLLATYEKIFREQEIHKIFITGGNRDFHTTAIDLANVYNAEKKTTPFLTHHGLRLFYQNYSKDQVTQ
jgi:type III pantothenate kinase